MTSMIIDDKETYPFKFNNLKSEFIPWLKEADNRIFSLAAGDRIAPMAEKIMQLGFGKILFAANELGADIDKCKPFVIFAPDGTCTYNKERLQRGFTYGSLIDAEFDGLMAAQNAMPNGCGFSLYELDDFKDDENLQKRAKTISDNISEDHAKQLGKGNHFISIFHVRDRLSGEDTGRRFIIVHASGHDVDKAPMYNQEWLKDEDGYNKIATPHGPIWLLESDAKKMYINEYQKFEKMNSSGREKIMKEFFSEIKFELISDTTHQGLTPTGKSMRLGIQLSEEDLIPVAFNAEEGATVVKVKPNLNKQYLETWPYAEKSERYGYNDIFTELDILPHGSGYEFLSPLKEFTVNLNNEGLENFSFKIVREGSIIQQSATYFKEIREYMSYKRKAPIMEKIYEAKLGEHFYDMTTFFQIHPKVSIPGGQY